MKEIWLMYLRKSRADNPDESVEEVLAKHETILQEYAQREFGQPIDEKYIRREVVSGESIEDRIEIKKVLREIENPMVKGVLVVEPQRLSRGDLEDCGRLINDLKYTNTLVGTPMMTYDMNNKMERRFFQDELLRGRDYLEYVKEILWRGRVASAKRGCFIASKPPFGYDRVKLGKDWTLAPNNNADIVRLMFDMAVNQVMLPSEIATVLNERGIATATDSPWTHITVRNILNNPHYTGKIVYAQRKSTIVIEDGERKIRHLARDAEEVVTVEGKHPAIIDQEIFDRYQELKKSRSRASKEKKGRELKNPLAGILVCAVCGRTMKYGQTIRPNELPRYECTYGKKHCKSVTTDKVIEAVIQALEQSELPSLERRLNGGTDGAVEIQKNIIANLKKQLAEYREQEEAQYELLEKRMYTQEVFNRRNSALREKIAECEEKIRKAEISMPKAENLAEKVVSLKKAVTSLRDDKISAKEKNRLLKAVIDRIEYSTAFIQEYGKTDFSLDITLKL